MDVTAIEKAGIKPVAPYLRQIDAIRTLPELKSQIAILHNIGISALFTYSASADLKNSNAVLASASQGGLTLPNRDYYTNDDANSVETRAKFIEYMTNMFKLLGDKPAVAAANAETVLAIQTRLAKASLTPVERRNPDNNYNRITLADAQTLTPNFSWANYMASRNSPAVNELNVSPAKFFTEMNAMMSDVPLKDWRTYLRWMTINAAAPSLSKAFVDENFNFFGKFLRGQKEQQPRWKTCVRATDGTLGEALGMVYAATAFKPEAKARMNQLIDNLLAAMQTRVTGLDWMSAETKRQAQAKLATFKRKIGYPDNLRGFKGLTIVRSSYAANVLSANRFQSRRNFEDLGKPRDKTR